MLKSVAIAMLLALMPALVPALNLAAQTAPGADASVEVKAISPPQLTLAKATDAAHPAAYCGTADKPTPCRLGDTLHVGMTGLRDWMTTGKVSTLYLVLNGREMKGLLSRGPDASYSILDFDLIQITTGVNDNRATWKTLLAELNSDPVLHVSMTDGGLLPYPSPVDVRFAVYPQWMWLVIVFEVLLLAGFLLLAVKSDIVRDAPAIAKVKQSYSLARCQMAWWFFIVSASFCYIWATLNDHDSLTSGVLILTGISAATGLAATVVGGDGDDAMKVLAAEQQALEARLAVLEVALKAAPADAVLTAEQAQRQARLLQIAQKDASEGFLKDILRDTTGISFHRFQMAGWTVILGFVFIYAVFSQLSMPDFSPTLLGLMGISSGTYIGFKISNGTS